MKRIGFLLGLALLVTITSQAQDYKMALGVRLSNQDPVINNSISFKYFTGRGIALEALLSFSDPGALGILVEKHKPVIGTSLMWYYGAGAYVGFSKSALVGLQGVLGLDFKLPDLPLNLSVDWKPEFNLVNTVTAEPAAVGVTVRFTF